MAFSPLAVKDGNGAPQALEAVLQSDGSYEVVHLEDATQRAALLAALAAIGSPSSSNAAVTTPTVTTVSSQILAANAARKGAKFYNNGSAMVVLLFGSGTASMALFSVPLVPLAYYNLEAPFLGPIQAVAQSGSVSLCVTELT